MSKVTTITLPWPLAKLSPNGRGHWRTKETARDTAKMIGFTEARNQTDPATEFSGRLQITLEIHPPDRKRYDWDNLVGRLKYYQDGICNALNVNDNQIKRAVVSMGDTTPNGAVIVTIEGG